MPHSSITTIDGSQGEGGGQILRSSVAIAAVTGRPVHIENIRAGRSKPGLMRQHLTAMMAAARICNAKLTGAELGSCELTFEPQSVSPGFYEFKIGTAGSATLVLQTVLPALLTADGASQVIVEGGTHNQWAPPFDFLTHAYLPQLNRMGPVVHASLERYGFFPAGGGRIVLDIQPAKQLAGFHLCERGAAMGQTARILISNLPISIAQREADKLKRKLQLKDDDVLIDPVSAHGPGNLVFAEVRSEHVTEIVTGFGRVGASAERVADEVVRGVRKYLASTAPVGEYLADQLLLPLGLSASQPPACGVARGGSFRTLVVSRHTRTHIDILQALLPVEIEVTQEDDGFVIAVRPSDVGTAS